jgi:hypothetical protein
MITLAIVAPAVFLLLISWTLTTPVGGYPDDSFHFANIWCDEGLGGYRCEDVGSGTTRLVPNVFTDGSPWWEVTGRGENNNIWDAYPTLYYSVMESFAGDNVVFSVLMMRLFNVLLAVLMFCIALLIMPKRLLLAFGLTWLAVGATLGFYYLASSHPFSWFYLGAGTFWVFVASLIESQKIWPRVTAFIFGGIAAVITVGSRPEGAVALLLSFLVGLVAAWLGGSFVSVKERWRELALNLRAMVLLLAVGVSSVVSYLFVTRSNTFNGVAIAGIRSQLNEDFWGQLIDAAHLYLYVIGGNARISEDGVFGPHAFFLLIALPAIVMVGVSRMSIGKAVVSASLVSVALVVPLGIQVDERGIVFTPPRYLTVYLLLVIVSLLLIDNKKSFGIASSSWKFIAVFLSIGHSLSLHSAMRPYAIGSMPSWQFGLNQGRKWWWSVGPSPQSAWLIGSICFGVLLFVVGRLPSLQDKPAT